MADSDSTTSKAPAFQFYPNDFLSDANVIEMSLQERGAYITLICICWQQGTLPNDVTRLAKLCGVPASVMRRLWPALASCFRPDAGERIVHPRLEREREKQALFRRRQSDKGKASAANRKATGGQPEVNRGSTAVQPEPQPKPNSSIFDLQSSSSDFGQKSVPRATTTGGVMAGSLPRDHLNCRPPCIRVCVSQKQHGILRERYGGEAGDADQALDAFYATVRARLPDQPIGDRPWQFWEQQFAAAFGTVATLNPKTAGNRAAMERFIARGKA